MGQDSLLAPPPRERGVVGPVCATEAPTAGAVPFLCRSRQLPTGANRSSGTANKSLQVVGGGRKGAAMKEEIRKAAWLMLAESSAHEEVAAECHAEASWHGTQRSALAQVSKWTSRDGPPLPAWAAAVIVRVCVPLGARDRLSPIFARAGFEAAQSMEDMRERAPLAKVRHPAAKGRARG